MRPPVSAPIVKVLLVRPSASVAADGLAPKLPGLEPGLTTLQLTSSPATGLPAPSLTRTCSARDSGRPGMPVSGPPATAAIAPALETTTVYVPVAVTGNCVLALLATTVYAVVAAGVTLTLGPVPPGPARPACSMRT
ncbi:MAG: hypothetical protein IPI73_17495 [Betaproteobacteria bacterium]|nr:hypothetical protein [Betaproteobacteria bacterium]